MTVMTPVVVDIFRGDKVESFADMKAAGIWGCIHKASQGKNYQDDCYYERRKLAEAAGLRWGAYVFLDNSDVATQVSNFVSACGNLDGLLLAADFEDNPASKSRNMSVAQLRLFLTLLMERTGRSPKGIWIYGGSRLKEEITSDEDCAFFGQFPLWIAQYGPKVTLPKAWNRWRLWQCSADGHGNPPHTIPGSSTQGIDLNVFGGDSLEAEWACMDEGAAVNEPVPAQAPQTSPHPATVAAKSPTTWLSLLLATIISHLTGYLAWIEDLVSDLWDHLPNIVNETNDKFGPATEILRIIGKENAEISFSLGIAILAIIVVRNVHLHLSHT